MPPLLPDLPPLDRLELDLDLRLAEIWQTLLTATAFDLEFVANLARWAYGRGYYDCLVEPVRGQLYRDHGHRVPKRASPQRDS